eukprot:9304134-Pyramimonas_sp.AAC.1
MASGPKHRHSLAVFAVAGGLLGFWTTGSFRSGSAFLIDHACSPCRSAAKHVGLFMQPRTSPLLWRADLWRLDAT